MNKKNTDSTIKCFLICVWEYLDLSVLLRNQQKGKHWYTKHFIIALCIMLGFCRINQFVLTIWMLVFFIFCAGNGIQFKSHNKQVVQTNTVNVPIYQNTHSSIRLVQTIKILVLTKRVPKSKKLYSKDFPRHIQNQ
jgi:hypothetical protein